jgi:hypothetical protein
MSTKLLEKCRGLQSCSKNVEDSNKHIIEATVSQVGQLPEKKET